MILNRNGSCSAEAAIVIPVFLLFIFMLFYLIITSGMNAYSTKMAYLYSDYFADYSSSEADVNNRHVINIEHRGDGEESLECIAGFKVPVVSFRKGKKYFTSAKWHITKLNPIKTVRKVDETVLMTGIILQKAKVLGGGENTE